MLAKRIQVIRKNQVQMGPLYVLSPGRSSPGVQESAEPAVCGGAAAAQARIVESNSDYVILEMICGCGRKSFVQCNYGNVAGSQTVQETQS